MTDVECVCEPVSHRIVVVSTVHGYRKERRQRSGVGVVRGECIEDRNRSMGLAAARARVRMGLSIRDAALRLDIHPSYLRRYERGTLDWGDSAETRRMSELYNLSLE